MVNAKEWVRRAYTVKSDMRRVMKAFDKVSNQYEDARDAAYASDALKARVDKAFTQLMKGRQTRKSRR